MLKQSKTPCPIPNPSPPARRAPSFQTFRDPPARARSANTIPPRGVDARAHHPTPRPALKNLLLNPGTMAATRAVLQVFEKYQKDRVAFVQTVAELATRPQNVEPMQSAGVMALLRPLLLDNVPRCEGREHPLIRLTRACGGARGGVAARHAARAASRARVDPRSRPPQKWHAVASPRNSLTPAHRFSLPPPRAPPPAHLPIHPSLPPSLAAPVRAIASNSPRRSRSEGSPTTATTSRRRS